MAVVKNICNDKGDLVALHGNVAVSRATVQWNARSLPQGRNTEHGNVITNRIVNIFPVMKTEKVSAPRI
jgi:hypothetical protein